MSSSACICGATRAGHPKRQRGFVLLGVLIALSLAALVAVQTGQRAADARQRADEEELLFVGEQYREAIQSYWRQSPGTVHAWPATIDDLLEDRRFPQARRHLRRAFVDPMAPATPWGLVMQGQALIGVYSQAEGTPFRQTGFTQAQQGFEEAQRYADWRFVAAMPAAASAPALRANDTPARPAPRVPGNAGRRHFTPSFGEQR